MNERPTQKQRSSQLESLRKQIHQLTRDEEARIGINPNSNFLLDRSFYSPALIDEYSRERLDAELKSAREVVLYTSDGPQTIFKK